LTASGSPSASSDWCSSGFARKQGVEQFAPRRHPIYVWEDAAGTQVYGFPALGGRRWCEGRLLRRHRRADKLTREVADQEVVRCSTSSPTGIPALGPEVSEHALHVHHDAGRALRPRLPRCGEERVVGLFAVLRPWLQVRARHRELVADLVTSGSVRFDISLFDPDRFSKTLGARNAVRTDGGIGMTINLRAPASVPHAAGRAYSDPEFFALERERLFARSWSAVHWRPTLPPGAFVEVELAGESVLVLRDHSGAFRSFFNVCRHRGSRLCTEISGHLERFIPLSLPAWTYALDGRLIAGPGIKSMEAADLEGFGLEPVATHVWQGQIWCCLDPRPPSFRRVGRGPSRAPPGEPGRPRPLRGG